MRFAERGGVWVKRGRGAKAKVVEYLLFGAYHVALCASALRPRITSLVTIHMWVDKGLGKAPRDILSARPIFVRGQRGNDDAQARGTLVFQTPSPASGAWPAAAGLHGS